MMRYFILVSLLFVVGSLRLSAQPADSLSNCKTLEDTLQYVQRKFVDHKDEYIGKPASVIFEAYQKLLPVGYVAMGGTSPKLDPERKGNSYVNRVSLYSDDMETVQHIPSKQNLIFSVKLEETKLNFYEIGRNIPDEEFGKVETLKYVKDFIVKDISVYLSHPEN